MAMNSPFHFPNRETPAHPAESHRRYVVLCLHEANIVSDVRATVLEEAGYSVLRAATAEAAMELFLANPVDLVLSDHLLQDGETGSDFVKQVRRLRPGIAIALHSGIPGIHEAAKHADGFISRDAGSTQMLVEVATLLKL